MLLLDCLLDQSDGIRMNNHLQLTIMNFPLIKDLLLLNVMNNELVDQFSSITTVSNITHESFGQCPIFFALGVLRCHLILAVWLW
jgi:hypothetical protein